MQSLKEAFESSIWREFSGFHDAVLLKFEIDSAGQQLKAQLLVERESTSKETHVAFVFGEVSRMQFITQAPRSGFESFEFPRNASIESFDVVGEPNEDGTPFTMQGIYGWSLVFHAKVFSATAAS